MIYVTSSRTHDTVFVFAKLFITNSFLGLCHPLLAQTSTTPHTEVFRHRGRRSCAWSLETYRSCREPRSKGLFFMIFPFPQFEFRIILIGFSVFWVYGFWLDSQVLGLNEFDCSSWRIVVLITSNLVPKC